MILADSKYVFPFKRGTIDITSNGVCTINLFSFNRGFDREMKFLSFASGLKLIDIEMDCLLVGEYIDLDEDEMLYSLIF